MTPAQTKASQSTNRFQIPFNLKLKTKQLSAGISKIQVTMTFSLCKFAIVHGAVFGDAFHVLLMLFQAGQ